MRLSYTIKRCLIWFAMCNVPSIGYVMEMTQCYSNKTEKLTAWKRPTWFSQGFIFLTYTVNTWTFSHTRWFAAWCTPIAYYAVESLSVRLSVTFRQSVKTAKYVTEILSPPDNSRTKAVAKCRWHFWHILDGSVMLQLCIKIAIFGQ